MDIDENLFRRAANAYAGYRSPRGNTDESYCESSLARSTANLATKEVGYIRYMCNLMDDDVFPFYESHAQSGPYMMVAPWNIDIWAEFCGMRSNPDSTRPIRRCAHELHDRLEDRHEELERMIGPIPEDASVLANAEDLIRGEGEGWMDHVWSSTLGMWESDPATAEWFGKAQHLVSTGRIGRVGQGSATERFLSWYSSLSPSRRAQFMEFIRTRI